MNFNNSKNNRVSTSRICRLGISTDLEIIPKTNINEPKAIALVDNASMDAKKTDGTIRTMQFRRGASLGAGFILPQMVSQMQPTPQQPPSEKKRSFRCVKNDVCHGKNL